MDLVLEPIKDVVIETASRFEKMTTQEEVDFTLDISSQTPVWHNKRGIGSIVLNLLFNAWKYTGEDKKISLEVKDDAGCVIISVIDNGIGISEKEVPRIFEPFYRVDSRLRGRSPGAGLGLAIVSHLVHAHAGSLLVDSKEGEGSKFHISLPIPAQT